MEISGNYAFIADEDGGLTVATGLNASLGNGQITLTWGANSEPDLAEYRLYRFALPQKDTE